MKILVTGAAGFIGSQMAEHLSIAGHEVIGLDNFSDYYNVQLKRNNAKSVTGTGAKMIEGNLSFNPVYRILPHDFDLIFHFAAQPGLSVSSTFQDYFENNVIATKQLLKFAENNKSLKCFVNISTSSVYGLDATKDEKAEPLPVSDYGVSKLAAEKLAMTAAQEERLPACSMRLYSVYGPRERPDKLYTKLINCLRFDNPFTLYEGSLQHLRSFTFVDDIISGLTAVIDNLEKVTGEIINIGNDKQHSTAEGIATMEKIFNKKLLIDLKPPRSGDQQSTLAIIDKAKQLLNYNPITSFEEGLRKQVDWSMHLSEDLIFKVA